MATIINGTANSDTIIGTPLDDAIYGLDGDDDLYGNTGYPLSSLDSIFAKFDGETTCL